MKNFDIGKWLIRLVMVAAIVVVLEHMNFAGFLHNLARCIPVFPAA